jgi:hypothetical protein
MYLLFKNHSKYFKEGGRLAQFKGEKKEVKTKINFATLALTSFVCLLPVILGVAVYGDLPDTQGTIIVAP